MGGKKIVLVLSIAFYFQPDSLVHLDKPITSKRTSSREDHSKQLKLIRFYPNQTHEQVRSLQVTLQEGLKDQQKDTEAE